MATLRALLRRESVSSVGSLVRSAAVVTVGVSAAASVAVVASRYGYLPSNLISGITGRSLVTDTTMKAVSVAAGDGSSTTASSEHVVLGNGECDCAPLWECMKMEGADCRELDRQLKACLAAHNLVR
eukprot:TRINITY_DN10976_c0_g2_i1.p1 TRINITY_DN10976_c0_g2~~TRINITY_DN10976_c0_g2_i1.p1  ORF type:complete len:127 (-),score=2.22 TRINITY_DN10976_c0_g2_i1:211-591(-)